MWKYESSLRAAQASAIAVMVSSRDGTVAEGKIPSKSGCFLCRAPLLEAGCIVCTLHSPSSSIHLSPAAFGVLLLLFWMPKLAASHGVLGSWVPREWSHCPGLWNDQESNTFCALPIKPRAFPAQTSSFALFIDYCSIFLVLLLTFTFITYL